MTVWAAIHVFCRGAGLLVLRLCVLWRRGAAAHCLVGQLVLCPLVGVAADRCWASTSHSGFCAPLQPVPLPQPPVLFELWPPAVWLVPRFGLRGVPFASWCRFGAVLDTIVLRS